MEHQQTSQSEVKAKAIEAKQTAPILASLTTSQKNEALLQMADAIIQHKDSIIEANEIDLEQGRTGGLSSALLDRLALNAERIEDIADGLRKIAELPDPIGEVLEEFVRPNGMRVVKKRVPIGLIGMIYEARPNVTVDAAGLALKTGNAVLLRGGSSALQTNTRLVAVLHEALTKTAIPAQALQLVENPDRASVNEMITLNGILDIVIPRGGASLIQNVLQNATVPVIETGAGICHTYIDAEADPEMAHNIAMNAKIQRPSVCNAMETLLVHAQYAEKHLLSLAEALEEAGVEIKGCDKTRLIIPWAETADDEDYATEYNDYILNIKVVENVDEALAHIDKFGTMHSECIVTENEQTANKFLQQVDAAAVYHNVSTRFTDGFEFGFGAEIGISTQKLHARGPMGLPALTTSKYIIYGNGQIRQ